MSGKYGDAKGFLREHIDAFEKDCIIWPHSISSSGYGQITIDGAKRNVHVIVLERHYGPRPTSSHEAAHFCGNRACMNWRHLRWATGAENQADRIAHGTDCRGERNPQAKLTEYDVAEIRRLHSQRWPLRDIASAFYVSRSNVSMIVARKTWKSVA